MPNAVKYKTGNLTGSLQKGNVALGVSGSLGPTSTTGWYNGPNPPTSGLYQIIETAASGDPDVYCPQNDAELIKFARWKGATGADTGSAAAVLAWIGTQTNLMAANFQYENIVTDGLVLNLDAGFVGSYPTINTTWYDLSGNTNNGTLTNGPTFNSANSGSIVFDGVDDFVVAPSVLNLPNLNSNFTINIFTKPTAASYGNIFVLADSGYNNECQVLLNNNTILVTKYGGTSLITGGSISLNTWYNITYVQNNSVGFLYINGTPVQSNAITPQTSAISNIILGAYNTSAPQPYGGYTAIAQVYNRALSAAEITQNYNAQKGRFGL